MKTRTEQRSRLVPQTIDGQTEMVLQRYTVNLPVPPRDWDRLVLTGVTAVAALIGAACIVWSTASIGDLLARVVVPPAAYAAAGVFDLAWISCMALEWLARYDQQRAALPRNAGYVALALAMLAVGSDGWIADQPIIGIVGAAVSGLAKGLWTVVLAHHAKPLDDLTQQWVDKQRAKAGGELAMVAVRRELARARTAVEAEADALRTNPDADPDASGESADDSDGEALPTVTGPMTIADAVRTAADCGIREPDAVLRYVRKVADANARPDTVSRYLRALAKGA